MSQSESSSVLRLSDDRALAYEFSHPPAEASSEATSRPVVLLSNSLCAPYATWDKVVPQLHNEGFSVLRYDQPGHGLSSAPGNISETTFATLANDVTQLLAHLGIKELAAWIGVSMGGATGMHVAASHPGLIKTLIVCDCPSSHAGPRMVLAPLPEVVGKAGEMAGIADGLGRKWFSDEWRAANSEEWERVLGIMRQTSVDGFRTCINALTDGSFDLTGIAPKIGTCVNVAAFVVGERDGKLPETMAVLRDAVQEGFNNSGRTDYKVPLSVVPGAGHICYVDNPSGFMEAVLPALRG